MSEGEPLDSEVPVYENRSASLLRANIFALLLVGPPVIALTLWFVSVHGWLPLYLPIDAHPYMSIFLLVVGILAHELLHAVAWTLFARPPKGAVQLGFYWKALTPYAHCSAPMTSTAYRIGAVTPGILLGVIPMIVGVALGWGGWMSFGILFTMAAGGDALIVWLLRGVPGDQMVKDHPTRAGCLLLRETARTSKDEAA